jgi:hypothetical protein
MSAPGPPDPVEPTEPTDPETAVPSARAVRRGRRRERLLQRRAEERTPELDAYVARTQTALDLLALCTIWLSFLPLTGDLGDARAYWLLGRLGLSLIFLADLLARTRRAAHPSRYWRTHPVLVAAVLVPPVRVLFSLRLLGEVFRRGNLARFVFVAVILAVNIAIVVWAFEHSDPAANIDSIWLALWWAVVTVTTTGYGDYVPITVGGRVSAVALMALGLTTLAPRRTSSSATRAPPSTTCWPTRCACCSWASTRVCGRRR